MEGSSPIALLLLVLAPTSLLPRGFVITRAWPTAAILDSSWYEEVALVAQF